MNEKNKQYQKKFLDKNPNYTKERGARPDVKEKRREYNKKYRERNKEKLKEYRELNREHLCEYMRNHHQQNKEKAQKYYENIYNNIANDKVSRGALNSDELYYEVLVTHKKTGTQFIKIGVTKHDVRFRYNGYRGEFDFEVLTETFGDHEYVKSMERLYKYSNKENKYVFSADWKFPNHTECFNTFSSL